MAKTKTNPKIDATTGAKSNGEANPKTKVKTKPKIKADGKPKLKAKALRKQAKQPWSAVAAGGVLAETAEKQPGRSESRLETRPARLAKVAALPKGPGAAYRYPLAEIGTLPDDIRARILAVQEKSGFVPNVFLKLARRPAEFRAFFDYYDALMLKEGGLSKAEREMIVVATSALNHCLYCVVAHGAILRIYQKDPLIADQVATNYRKAALTARQRAMLDFACKVAVSSATVDDADHRLLQAHGFDAEDAWDIAAITAFFALSNRIANFSAMMPNDEFYSLGRTPPAQSARPAR